MMPGETVLISYGLAVMSRHMAALNEETSEEDSVLAYIQSHNRKVSLLKEYY